MTSMQEAPVGPEWARRQAYDLSLLSERVRGVEQAQRGRLQPIGCLQAFAGTTAPAGWLLCAGQAVSRAVYAMLFDVVSTTFGAGDGSTTFNVPDLRGRTIAGLDNLGGSDAGRLDWANTLGTAGGAQQATLRAAIGAMSADAGRLGYRADPASVITTAGSYSHGGLGIDSTSRTYSHHTPVYDATNGTEAVQRMQPTMLLAWIILAGT